MFLHHWFLTVLTIALLLFLLSATTILFGSQVYMIAKNTTSIEVWLKHWATQDAKENNQVRIQKSIRKFQKNSNKIEKKIKKYLKILQNLF